MLHKYDISAASSVDYFLGKDDQGAPLQGGAGSKGEAGAGCGAVVCGNAGPTV
jgi:hypothetical protein